MMAAQVKPRVGAADLLTVLRFPLAALFPIVHGTLPRLGIVAAAAATDLCDGWIARRTGGSRWGPILDPVADKAPAGGAARAGGRQGGDGAAGADALGAARHVVAVAPARLGHRGGVGVCHLGLRTRRNAAGRRAPRALEET